MKNVLVLGLGNILMGDEGLGVRMAEILLERYDLPENVEVVDGGTAGMDLMETIAESDVLIVTDAIFSEKPAGTVIKLTDREVDAFFRARTTPHQVGLIDVLASLHLTDEYPDRLVIVGVVPKQMELGVGLTPETEAACEAALPHVLEELKNCGVTATLKQPPLRAQMR